MTLKQFIRQHWQDIDRVIQSMAPGAPRNDEERRVWVLNDEGLYNWAKEEGVQFEE